MRLVINPLVAAVEHGVVEGGGELADSTTDIIDEFPAQNHRRRHVSLFEGALTDVLVEGELLSG